MEIKDFDRLLDHVNFIIAHTSEPQNIITYKFVEVDEIGGYSITLEIKRGSTLIYKKAIYKRTSDIEQGRYSENEIKSNLIKDFIGLRIAGKSAQEVAIEKGEIKLNV